MIYLFVKQLSSFTFYEFVVQPITDVTASHRLVSLRRCVSAPPPPPPRSSAATPAAERCGQKRSPRSMSLSSSLCRRGNQSAGTSRSQRSTMPFFTSMCSRAEDEDDEEESEESVRCSSVWTLNFGVFPNVQSQPRSSDAARLTPGNAASSEGSTEDDGELKPNSEDKDSDR